MSIATAITTKQQQVADSYTAVSNKGGTLPATQNLTNLATAISSIPSGTTPTGTLSITENGTYNVTNYANANINVSSISIPREISVQGKYQIPTNDLEYTFPNTVLDIGPYALAYAFCGHNSTYAVTGVKKISFPSLTTISGYGAFQSAFSWCTGLTTIEFPSLTTISADYVFASCFNHSGITTIEFPSLTTISGSSVFGSSFTYCSNLTTVNFPALTTISGSYTFSGGFSGCSNLTTVRFTSLSSIPSQYALRQAFQSCSKIQNVYFNSLTTSSFGSYTNQFENLLNATGTTRTHTLHFPSNLQSTISGLTGYPNFGGSSNYITLAFDLPATS